MIATSERLLPRLPGPAGGLAFAISGLILGGMALGGMAWLAVLASGTVPSASGVAWLAIVAGVNVPLAGWIVALAWLAIAASLALFAGRAPLWRVVTACVLAGLALRLLAFWAMDGLAGVRTGNDYAAYLSLAANLLDGSGLAAGTEHYGLVRGMYPPLYPLLLAGPGALAGVNSGTVLLVNSVVDLGSAWLILAIAGRIGEEQAGRIAASLYLLWPGFVLSAPLAQKEGLIALLALLNAYFIIRTRLDGPSWRNAMGLGCGTALIALCQPALLTLPMLMALALLPAIGIRKLLLLAARCLPFAIALMLPWWIRNWWMFGAFVPLTTSAGASMMVAASGEHVTLGPGGLAMAEPVRSAILTKQALSLIAADPAGFAIDRAIRIARALSIETEVARRLIRFEPPFAWGQSMLPALQASHLSCVGLALWSLLRPDGPAGRRVAGMLVAAGFVQILIVQPWFEFGERHRLFLTPFLLLLAALPLAAWARARRRVSPSPDDACIEAP